MAMAAGFYIRTELTLFSRMLSQKIAQTAINVLQKSYSLITGNRGRESERRGRIFDQKLLNSRFCACAVKQCPQLAYLLSNRHNIIAYILYRQSRSLNTTVTVTKL